MMAGIALLVGSGVQMNRARSTGIKSFTYFSLCLLSFSVYFLLKTLASLLSSVLLYKVHSVVFFAAVFFFLKGSNYSSRNKMSLVNTGITCALSALSIFMVLEPGNVSLSARGQETFISNPYFEGIMVLGALSFFLFLMEWSANIWRHATKKVKAELIVFASCISLFFPIGVFSFLLGGMSLEDLTHRDVLFEMFPASEFIITLGLIGAVFVLIKDPRISSLIPFPLYSLFVLERGSGKPLLTHEWRVTGVEDVIYSGILNALQKISKSIFRKGDLRKIILEKGLLSLCTLEHVIVCLFSARNSSLTEDALRKFSLEFERRFLPTLEGSGCDVLDSSGVRDLIDAHFTVLGG